MDGSQLPELTEEEILEFRTQKYYALLRETKRREYNAQLTAPQFPTITTPEQFLDYCETRLQTMIDIDEHNQHVILTLASYFSGLRNQHTEGMDFEKGILLFGNVGTGKTTLMRLMCECPHAPFQIVSAQEVVNEYQKKDGVQILESYTRLTHNPVGGRYFGNRNIGLCIDDVGTETEGRSFGNQKNVVGELIMSRYANLRGPYTHLTTNATREELKAYYGLRAYDRMKEMFNVVAFPKDAESRRK
jgi:DNA replication protein DnaC